VRCAVDIAPLRRKPDDDSEQLTQALRAEPLEVIDRDGDWARVVTAYDYPGWVHESELEEGEGSIELGSEPVLEAARAYLGSPYEWGGMTHRGIDCSGLAHMAYRAAGALIPRDARQQQEAAEHVETPEPGDLAFYGDGFVDHVAFWLGDGWILHATGRDALGVLDEPEPAQLTAGRRGFFRVALPNPR
jgi:cell wall-associated NlpC family hydrolase